MATRLYKVGTVSVTNGSNIVTGSGTNWANAADKPQAGDLFSLDLDKFYEIIATTNTQITLDRNFAGTTQSGVNYSIVRHSSAGDIQSLNLAISNLINNRESFVDSLDDVVSGDADEVTHVNRFNQSKQIPTLKKARDDFAAVQAQAESLVGSIVLPNQAEFESRYEGKYAGAGFSDWGKGTSHTDLSVVNEGMILSKNDSTSSRNGKLTLGTTLQTIGSSRMNFAQIYVAGSIIRLEGTDSTGTYGVHAIFPEAPDGLDKADGTGRFANLNEAIVAGGTSLSASVIHRQDLVILESWDEDISNKGNVLYPYGNVQYGGSWSGITLATSHVAQGYSAFFVGDTTTTGKGFILDLTNDNHVKFLQDKDNNCYTDNGKIIQRRYRIRTIAGLEGDWANTNVNNHISISYNGGGLRTSTSRYVGVQGNETTPPNHNNGWAGSNDVFVTSKSSFLPTDAPVTKLTEKGAYTASGPSGSLSSKGHNGNCWAIPIALVQRRNKGAYHPVYNLAGSNLIMYSDGSNSANKWHTSSAKDISNASQCFDFFLVSNTNTVGDASPFADGVDGNIGSGTSGRPDGYYYDAIYASDVLDLRLSAHYVDYDTVNRVENAKNINATARGWEAMPFTTKIGVTPISSSATLYAHSGGQPTSLAPDINPLIDQYDDGDIVYVRVTDTGGATLASYVPLNTWIECILLNHNATSSSFRIVSEGNTSTWITAGNANALRVDVMWFGKAGGKGRAYAKPYYQAEPTWTDIIADPAVLVATFPDGVGGAWIPIIPDGTSKEYPLTKKSIVDLQTLRTDDNGTTWLVESGWTADVSVSNLVNQGAIMPASTRIQLLSYKAKANFVEPANLGKVLSGFGSVHFTNHQNTGYGSILSQSTIHKIPTNVSSGTEFKPFTKLPYINASYGDLIPTESYLGNNDSLSIAPVESPALKHFTYITERNGQLYQQIVAKEMVYDAVDGFGDNNVFEVTDGVKTKTDLNGNTVIYGCWERPLPYFTNNKVS